MNRRLLAILVGTACAAATSAAPLLLAASDQAQKAQIHIYWGKSTRIGWSCSKGTINVVLDTKPIAEIREKECVKTAVAPGEHVLQGIKQALVKRRDLIFDADAGKDIFIRGDCSNDSRIWEWNLQTKDQAKDWSASCRDAQ
jgi:hypothetical protein